MRSPGEAGSQRYRLWEHLEFRYSFEAAFQRGGGIMQSDAGMTRLLTTLVKNTIG
jgi:hypothetical protein